jgi:hypothetical protein
MADITTTVCEVCNVQTTDVIASRDERTNTWAVKCAECAHRTDTELATMGGLTQAAVHTVLNSRFRISVRQLDETEWARAVTKYEHWMDPNVFGHEFAACLSVCEVAGVRLPVSGRSSS